MRPDTQKAYDLICEQIITLALPPGHAINEQQLAESLALPLAPVQEALKLLADDHLVRLTPRHGTYVADVNVPDLDQISELRLSLESLAARLAAQRAGADDLVVLAALRDEQVAARVSAADPRRLFEIDHKFHQAVAAIAGNRYLAQTLDHFFGLSLRLWHLIWASPRQQGAGSLPSAIEKHLDLFDAIAAHDADTAERIMRDHVTEFYEDARAHLSARQ